MCLLLAVFSVIEKQITNEQYKFMTHQILTDSLNLQQNSRSVWMKGKYGLMVHWLSPPFKKPMPAIPDTPLPLKGNYIWDLNKATESFDIDGFMSDFDKTGADWLIFTIGQNTGTYASPNSVIDSLAGYGHTPQRDLVLEIAKAVKKRGKRFIAYLPCEIGINTTLQKGFGWNTETDTDQSEFQRLYLKVIREWSVRFGKNLDGWWFDGCYSDSQIFANKYVKWEAWYQASRAGNVNALVTFNDGAYLYGRTWPIRPEHDYLSGEEVVLINGQIRLTIEPKGPLFMPKTAYVEGTQCLYHVLLPIDGYWMYNRKGFPDWAHIPFTFKVPEKPGDMPSPVYKDTELIKFVRNFTRVGGGATLNANISQEGYLNKETIRQFQHLHKAMKNMQK